jgi:hypothetical protein
VSSVSVPVALESLREQVAEFGPVAFLLTVTDDGRPHIVSVNVAWDHDRLIAGAGRTTAANASRQPAVSLLWPAVGRGDYGLIVDGTAQVTPRADETVLTIAPTRAVLHRLASAGADGPSCITVL